MSTEHMNSGMRGVFIGLSIADQIQLGDRIRQEVAQEFGLAEEQLLQLAKGGSQDPWILRARRQAIVRMRQENMSWGHIASSLGYSEHQGPMYLVRRHGDWAKAGACR